jgi:glycine/D-amino acid oxidase-like deaminating enzyme
MPSYDWIIVGAGITGAALSYELVSRGCSVLLLEQSATPENATRYSYGGIAYWSGNTELTRQLCTEAKALYRSLPEELAAEFQFRELDLVLTIAPDADPAASAQFYTQFATPPHLLSVTEACELEPLLNPAAIAGALTVKHGHINAQALTDAYLQAAQRSSGHLQIQPVTGLIQQSGRITGVRCGAETYQSSNVVICAGGWTRSLLHAMGLPVRIYFTHTELIETPPVEVTLRSLVMPAVTQRFQLEADATTDALDPLWSEPEHELLPAILDVGAIQFQDGHFCLGQTSRTLTDPKATIDPSTSEAALRSGIAQILPTLQALPGTWRHCLVAFSCDRLPLIGTVPTLEGLQVFSGFSNPLVLVPPLARRFAAQLVDAAAEKSDGILAQMQPDRFTRLSS